MLPLRTLALLVLPAAAACHPIIVGAAAASGGGGGAGGAEDPGPVTVAFGSVDTTFVVPGASLLATVDLGGISGRGRELEFFLAPDGIGGSEPRVQLTPAPLTEVAGTTVTRSLGVPASTPPDSYRLVAQVRGGATTAAVQFDCPIQVGPPSAAPATEVWTQTRFSTANLETTGAQLLPASLDVVVTGDWDGTVTPSLGAAPSSGVRSMFLARLQLADGAVVAEHFVSPQAGGEVRSRGVAALADGTCVVAGFFEGRVDFGLDETTSLSHEVTVTLQSAFVVHYVFQGATVRVRRLKVFGSTSTVRGLGIAALPSGTETVLVGTWSGTAMSDGFTASSAGDSDGFVMRLASDLSVTWVAQIGGPEPRAEQCVAVAARRVVDPAPAVDEIAVTGFVQSGPGGAVAVRNANNSVFASLPTAGDSRDALAVTYLLDGSVQWAQVFGGTGSDEGRAVDLATDAGGTVWVGGIFRGSADFNTVNGGAGTLVSQAALPTDTNGFVAHYDGGSGNLRWVGGVLSGVSAAVHAVAFSDIGEVIAAGEFEGILVAGLEEDLEAGQARLGRTRSLGAADAFLVNLSTAGDPLLGGKVRRQVGFGGTGADKVTVLLAGPGGYVAGTSVRSPSVACEPLSGFTLGTNAIGNAVMVLDLP